MFYTKTKYDETAISLIDPVEEIVFDERLNAAFSFGVGGTNYTELNTVTLAGEWSFAWSNSIPSTLLQNFVFLGHDNADVLHVVNLGTYNGGEESDSNTGEYSFAVPEPGTAMSLGLGLTFLAMRRRAARP